MTEPAWMAIAEAELGQRQWPGGFDNPRVLEYLAACGLHPERDEGMAWCGCFATWAMLKAGQRVLADEPSGRMVCAYPPWWRGFGAPLDAPKVGAIAIRKTGLHVAFVAGVNGGLIDLLGGNQDDAVRLWTGRRAADFSYRWPPAGEG